MSFILTLVASDKPLSAGHLAGVERFCDLQGLGQQGDPHWQEAHKAADILITHKPDMAQIHDLREALDTDRIDLFVTTIAARKRGAKKLLICDMDATIVTGETLDEIAVEAGIGEKVSDITARAMRGELDFKAALDERVGLLRDHPSSLLDTVLEQTVLSKGAKTLVAKMKDSGATCVLVSGGFTFFTGAVADMCGFHHHHGNILDVSDNKLTGTVTPPILDKTAKLNFLKSYTRELGIDLADTLALGDGANDLPMLEAAGLGIGYHPKPLVAKSLPGCIIHGDLTAALYAQGIKP